MAKKKTRPSGLGATVGRLGNKVLDLEKSMSNELGRLREDMGRMFEHFRSQTEVVLPSPTVYLAQDVLPPSDASHIPYDPIFEEPWRKRNRAWKEQVMPRLDNLVYVGDGEDGVPMMADFEVQVPLPLVYLLMAERSGNRYRWIREHPYEEWKADILQEEK